MPKYKILQGIDYPPDKRAEVGDIVDDLPSRSIKWLREQNIIEAVDSKTKDPDPVAEPEPEPTPEPTFVSDDATEKAVW
jgi:hypothetical protein